MSNWAIRHYCSRELYHYATQTISWLKKKTVIMTLFFVVFWDFFWNFFVKCSPRRPALPFLFVSQAYKEYKFFKIDKDSFNFYLWLCILPGFSFIRTSKLYRGSLFLIFRLPQPQIVLISVSGLNWWEIKTKFKPLKNNADANASLIRIQ